MKKNRRKTVDVLTLMGDSWIHTWTADKRRYADEIYWMELGLPLNYKGYWRKT